MADSRAKADQIAFRMYSKLFHVVHAARASAEGPTGSGSGSGKTDKWFNLETPIVSPAPDFDTYRALSSAYYAYASTPASPSAQTHHQDPPDLVIEVLLAVPPPGGGTALVHGPTQTRVEPQPSLVLLEEWRLGCMRRPQHHAASSSASSTASSTTAAGAPSSSSSSSSSSSASETSSIESIDTEDGADMQPSTIYKNAIPLFRALYALLRVLPAWRVVRRMTGRRPSTAGLGGIGGARRGGLKTVVRVRGEESGGVAMRAGSDLNRGVGAGSNQRETVLRFGESPAPESGAPPLPVGTHVFPGISHPAGTLTLSATYLTTPAFTLESLEALLSSRFAVLDAHVSRPMLSPMQPLHPYTQPYPSPHAHTPTSAFTPSSAGPRRPLSPSAPSSRSPSSPTVPQAPFTRTASALARRPSGPEEPSDEDEDFLPTLARRNVTVGVSGIIGSSTVVPPSPGGRRMSNLGGGAGSPLGSPARYTVPLPPVAGPGSASTSTSASPGRYTSVLQQHQRQRSESNSNSSPHSQHHIRRDSNSSTTARGLDVDLDRFVLSKASGAPSSVGSESGNAYPYAGSGSTSGSGSGLVQGQGLGSGFFPSGRALGPLPSEREKEREREKGVPIYTTPAAIGSGGHSAASGSGSGSPIPINPFKSGTLSRSSLSGSLLRGSPGRGASPISVAVAATAAGGGGGVAFPMPGSPLSAVESAGGGPNGPIPVRKRYSSSFTHRYGSAGSGESGSSVKEARRDSFKASPPPSQSHADDVSSFVKDLDSAQPLLARYRHESMRGLQDDEDARGAAHDRTASELSSGSRVSTVRASSTSRRTTVAAVGAGVGDPGSLSQAPQQAQRSMLTSESEVDERLRRMNDDFMRSLDGLGSGSGSNSNSNSGSGSFGRLPPSDVQGSQEVIGRLEFDYGPSSQKESRLR
ncbi:unnamed protein product [Mycena citricolor]|uniref:Autophagy-related protein 13 n=1 Tax=Mycena citricolor TaxID=2018698 RepID=A0AAD2HHK5_9AGAR|nr:unnamed protein product [Mycena citricolor]